MLIFIVPSYFLVKSYLKHRFYTDSYWDISTDLKLMFDRTTLNLLYAQTVSDIEKGWIVVDKDTAERLATLQSRGAKREVIIPIIPLMYPS